MAWGRDVRTTEWVLEELYQTGRLWMNEAARRRSLTPAGDPGASEANGDGATELRRRFDHLVEEFCGRLDAAG